MGLGSGVGWLLVGAVLDEVFGIFAFPLRDELLVGGAGLRVGGDGEDGCEGAEGGVLGDLFDGRVFRLGRAGGGFGEIEGGDLKAVEEKACAAGVE